MTNDGGNEFFARLVRTIVIRASRDTPLHSVGSHRSKEEHLGCSFACRIRRTGEKCIPHLSGRVIVLDISIHFIRRNVEKTDIRMLAANFNQTLNAKNIRLQKWRSALDAPINV
jgi:hypothetical protein